MKKILLVLAFLTCNVMVSQAQTTLNHVRIEGNQRIESETILAYMGLEEGEAVASNQVDNILKQLFATELFADVKVSTEGNTLVVNVQENPLVNRIAFEGAKRVKGEDLEKELELQPRQVFTRSKVLNDTKRIQNIYQRLGRYAVQVEPKIIERDQNRVDVVFEITEGKITEIKKITFIGNKNFSDRRLRNVIKTEESEWYRFLSSDDTYDPDRIAFDKELLRNFYLNHGYADFQVKSVTAELTPEQDGFFLTFSVEEGEIYNFGEIQVVSHIEELPAASLVSELETVQGELYRAKDLESTIENLSDKAGNLGYAFVEVRPQINRNAEAKTIDITYDIEEGERIYVERINIIGNVRTKDHVIRRQMLLVEGDAFSRSKIERSEQRIKDLDFFSKVKISHREGSAYDKAIIEVEVEEKSTGELMLSAGFSTLDGPLVGITLKERNVLGTGHEIGAFASLSKKKQNYTLSYTDPFFLDYNLRAGIDVFHRRVDLQKESSFNRITKGFSLRAGYDVTERWSQGWKYTLREDDIQKVKSTSSRFIRNEIGKTIRSSITHNLTFVDLDSKIDPSEGVYLDLESEIAGLGGDVKYARNELTSAYYIPLDKLIADDYVFALKGNAGIVGGYGNQFVRLADRFFIGGDKIRGFERGGIGPRDLLTKDALGGTKYVTASAEVNFPIGFTDELGFTGSVFADAGTLTGAVEKATGVVDEASIRSSVGVGLTWKSPFGPVRIDIAKAITKEDFDETEVFNLNFGTRF